MKKNSSRTSSLDVLETSLVIIDLNFNYLKNNQLLCGRKISCKRWHITLQCQISQNISYQLHISTTGRHGETLAFIPIHAFGHTSDVSTIITCLLNSIFGLHQLLKEIAVSSHASWHLFQSACCRTVECQSLYYEISCLLLKTTFSELWDWTTAEKLVVKPEPWTERG